MKQQLLIATNEGYRYDIFFSYSRGGASEDWLNGCLKELLEKHLQEEMGRIPQFYIDTEMRAGVNWYDDIKEALLRSRCLLGVWSGPYFYRKYCLTEWRSMKEREKVVSGKSGSCKLIYPVKFGDGDHFSDEANETQYDDLSNWAFIGPAFRNSPEFVEFEKRVKDVARSLWQIIKHAPEWEPGWPFIEVEPPLAPVSLLPRM